MRRKVHIVTVTGFPADAALHENRARSAVSRRRDISVRISYACRRNISDRRIQTVLIKSRKTFDGLARIAHSPFNPPRGCD